MAAPARMDAQADPSFAELLALRPHLAMAPESGLMVEGVPLARIAAEHGTPTWVYAASTIAGRYRALASALAEAGLAARIHYAMKANDALAIVRLLAALGAGADVVSGGEFHLARAAGIAPPDIVFSGVGKTEDELRAALAAGVGQINVESAEELAMLDALATSMGRSAPVALRVNPDVDAGTHAKITTGRAENKFGIPIGEAPALYARAAGSRGLRVRGVAVHIGSQITALAPFRAAYARLAELVRALRAEGLPVERIDCGGGLGIPYRDEPAPSADAFAHLLRETLGPLGVTLMLEPGRWLVGPAGLLLARVVLEKHGTSRRFVILDAAMNDLIRPALYEAWHAIVPVAATRWHAPATPADVVGPVCESGDTFATARMLPALPPGELVAILDAGAYGAVMSSTYNARPLAGAVMVRAGEAAVIRRRQPVEALIAQDVIPHWLASGR
ncbi:diaminopimelate decarboxylase [Elioraea sp.]|uniref:diaminopimelate decarboxylase n=1 Tax=Elioraea sp. TaxID=2185103 RepID=UPI00307F05C3